MSNSLFYHIYSEVSNKIAWICVDFDIAKTKKIWYNT